MSSLVGDIACAHMLSGKGRHSVHCICARAHDEHVNDVSRRDIHVAIDTYIYSERSEVSTRGPIERMWLRQNSKMPHFVAKSVLALSFTSHASS